MKNKNWAKVILVVALFSAVIAGLEAGFYITLTTEDVLENVKMISCISFIIRNIVSCFAFSPMLSLTDVFGHMSVQAENPPSVIYQWVTIVYAIVLVVAPICTASAFFVFFGDVLRSVWGKFKALFMKKPSERVILIGTNPSAVTMVEHELSLTNNREVIYITSKAYSRREKIEFVKNRITLVEIDLQSAGDAAFQKLMKKIFKKGIQGLILAEDSATDNFSLYMRIMELCREELTEDLICCCRSGNSNIRQLFIDYYTDHRKEGCIAPKFFSVSQMRAYSILEHSPLPIKTSGETLRILIGGFGHTGQQTLLDAIVMGIGSSNSRIEADIVDIHIKKRRDEFLKNVSSSLFNITEDSCELKSNVSDGSLVLRFHEMDVSGSRFMDLIRKKEYDYASLCIENVETCVQSVIEMNRLIALRKKTFPITVSLMTDPEIAFYLEKEQKRYRHVYILGTKEFLNVDHILHTSLEDQARSFHEVYRRISLSSLLDYRNHEPESPDLESPIVRWATMALYKQEDSRFVSRHQSVKEAVANNMLGDQLRERLVSYFGPEGTIFRPYDNSYVFDEPADELIRRINADPFLREMGALEHRRWCYAKAISGWSRAEKKNDTLKETPYLIGWEELCRKYPDMCLYDFMPLLMMLREEK